MTDNFELIKKMLLFYLPEHFYFVQLLRRQADDPMIDGKPNPLYHGDMHSRSLKNYFLRTPEDLDKVKPDIIKLCKEHDVRAYIRLNRRSNKAVSIDMYEHIWASIKGGTFKNPERLLSSACGKSCSEPKATKSWLIDVDKEYLPFQDMIVKIICACRSKFKEQPIIAYIPSKSGLHMITHPFNKDDYANQWYALGTTVLRKAPVDPPAIHADNPTILYAP